MATVDAHLNDQGYLLKWMWAWRQRGSRSRNKTNSHDGSQNALGTSL
jgi:hypothetical protein